MVASALAELSLATTQGQGEALDRKATLRLFGKYLNEYSAGVIQSACEAWVRGGNPFFPKVGELRQLCEAEHEKNRARAARLRWLIREAGKKREADAIDKAMAEKVKRLAPFRVMP